MLWGKVYQNQKNFRQAVNLKKRSRNIITRCSKKVEKIEAKELKPVDTAKYFEDPDANLFIPGSYVAPTLTPQKVFSKKVKAQDQLNKK